MKNIMPNKLPNPIMKRCKCGCRAEIPKFDKRGRERVYLLGHGAKRNLPELKYRKIYRSWSGMKTRCLNPNNVKYPDYGGRGITICDEWLEFDNFYADMEDTWTVGLSIDRIDNSKGYNRENCRWSNGFQQANNKRNNFIITCGSKSLTISQWGKYLGIPRSMISQRIHAYGWSELKAINYGKKHVA